MTFEDCLALKATVWDQSIHLSFKLIYMAVFQIADCSFNQQHCLSAPAETAGRILRGPALSSLPSLWVSGRKVPIKINGLAEVIRHGHHRQSSFHKANIMTTTEE